MYEDLNFMKECVANVGKNILKSGLPEALHPMVFAFTGTGRVAKGVEEILEILPHIKVDPDHLKDYMKGGPKYEETGNRVIIS